MQSHLLLSELNTVGLTYSPSSLLSPVHLTTMSHSFDQNAVRLISDTVNNPIVPDSNPEPTATALKSNDTDRPWIFRQSLKTDTDPFLHLRREPVEGLPSDRPEDDPVCHPRL